MLKLYTAIIVFALLPATSLNAQTADQPAPGPHVTVRSSIPSRSEANFSAITGSVGTFYSSAGTPGQPFSADSIEETDRSLTDGNHIHQENHGKIFRDSQGRVRSEVEVEAETGIAGIEAARHITITDPVEGHFLILDPRQKTAMLINIRHDAKPANQNSANTNSTTRSRLAAQPGMNTPGSASQTSGLAVASTGYVGGGLSASTKQSTEDLGTRVIEGFTVTGTRTSFTIPAGKIGNEKPMVTTSETWFSDDLKIVLLSTSESPESGKHVHKLLNIHTGDPDPLLFQVPADFTIKETPQK